MPRRINKKQGLALYSLIEEVASVGTWVNSQTLPKPAYSRYAIDLEAFTIIVTIK